MAHIPLKNAEEMDLMRRAGKLLEKIRDGLEKEVKKGVTTVFLDSLAEKLIRENGAEPAFKGYRGFPGNICISINNQVVHGIPGSRRLFEGDVVSIDMGIKYKGYFSDMAFTKGVGKISLQAKRLIACTRKALAKGIKNAREGKFLSDISYAIETYTKKRGYSVVKDFVGHGIGRKLHEDPPVPNYGPPGRGPRLKAGMVLAIEPMVNIGGSEVKVERDNWTVVTRDGSLSAHFEHTVAITSRGPRILTK